LHYILDEQSIPSIIPAIKLALLGPKFAAASPPILDEENFLFPSALGS